MAAQCSSPLTAIPFYPFCFSNPSAPFSSISLPLRLPYSFTPAISPLPPFSHLSVLLRHPLLLRSSPFPHSLFFFVQHSRPTSDPIVRHRFIRSVSKQAHPAPLLSTSRSNLAPKVVAGHRSIVPTPRLGGTSASLDKRIHCANRVVCYSAVN